MAGSPGRRETGEGSQALQERLSPVIAVTAQTSTSSAARATISAEESLLRSRLLIREQLCPRRTIIKDPVPIVSCGSVATINLDS
jgi:hypothetical protein